ncbi:MAG: cytidylyltransferase domain-containing protein, partial [Opitutales bacterium]
MMIKIKRAMATLPTILVPARLGSTRFPRKLLHEIRGKPVILWTAERIRSEAPEFPLYFAVDEPELERCLDAAGFNVVRTRRDHPSGTDRLAEANASIGASAAINVQGDEPLVTGFPVLNPVIWSLWRNLNNCARLSTVTPTALSAILHRRWASRVIISEILQLGCNIS